MNDLRQVKRFPHGVIAMPPSKSVSHRAIICAGLAEGKSEIDHIAYSQDIEATLRCMAGLGMNVHRRPASLSLQGGLRQQTDLLDCGESGSTLRFLIPLAALFADSVSFTGRGRLMQRPLGPYMEVLAAHGVSLSWEDDVLTLAGPLQPGLFRLPGDISSQFVSGLLFALPLLEGDSEIEITSPLQSAAYVDLTIATMERFGIRIESNGKRRFMVAGGQSYRPTSMTVESDYSQAAFFLVAGALGCACECRGLAPESQQGDKRILTILRQSGAAIHTGEAGGLIVKPARLQPQTVDVADIPDLVPPLAALFCFCEGTSRIINAERLRHKESDRLQAVAAALNAIGGQVAVGPDSLTITGVQSLGGGRVDSCGDHRIAMMGAVAAIRSRGTVEIMGSDCVAKSYPHFWQDFEKMPKEDWGQ